MIYEKLKPLFGIRKIGCHYNNKYIVYKPYEKDGVWNKEIRLSDFNNYSTFKYSMIREIRNCICFRYFFLLTNISEKNILYRDSYVVSFDDRKGKTNIETYTIPSKIQNRWFSEISVEQTICNLFKDYKNTINTDLRQLFIETIKTVDKKYIYLSSTFCNRLIDIFSYVESQNLHDKLDIFESKESRDNSI